MRSFLKSFCYAFRGIGYQLAYERNFRIHCFAAPIFDYKGTNIAAVSMACPYFEFETPGEQERLISLVRNYGMKMSEVLGYQQH